jgi:glycerol-3-phosphate acyltransferase PlsX
MGGDMSPIFKNVSGAVEAVEGGGFEVILVGDKNALEKELSKYAETSPLLRTEHAEETVGMDESPSSTVRRKRNSSIRVAVRLVKEGEAEAVVSAGNTGATVAAAKIQLGMLPHVGRPAIATLLPTPKGFSILLDAGANVDSKPENLYQFALMGSVYARNYCRRDSPRVGLLSIGEEKLKGNELTRETYELLKRSSINFIGNIEGKDIFTGNVDVIVCDGFVGNIVLKSSESLAEMFESLFREELGASWRGRFAGLLMKPIYRNFRKKLSHSEYGGALLLGVNGICVISHGSSSPKAIKNALFCAKKFVEHNLNKHIEEALAI